MRIAFVGDSLTSGIPGVSYLEILREKLDEDTLINLGRVNDTVVSLYHRVSNLYFDGTFDLTFLWVGVNDVQREYVWLLRIVDALLRQPPARSVKEFWTYYRATLRLLSRHTHRLIAVSPLLQGEDLNSRANRELGILAGVIEDLASHRQQTEYLDLRTIFRQKLDGQPISHYRPKSVLHSVVDAMLLRTREQVDRKSAQRGLHFTLDGVHLNSAGAEIVADAFLQSIRR